MNTYSRTLFILALSVFSSFNLSAQTIQLDIEHLSPISTKQLGSDYLIPNFSGMKLEGHKPFLEKSIEVAERETSIIKCKVLQKTILSKETSFYFSSNGIEIPTEVSFESKISNTKKELHFKLFPYIQENNMS